MAILDSLRPPLGLRVLVTAGASGIGAVIARAYVEAGAHVHVCDIDRYALDRLVSGTPGITSSMADVAVEKDVDLVFDDVLGTLGGLDVLVNNAGIPGPMGAIETLDSAHWERTLAVNLGSQFLFARRAVPLLKQSRANPCLVAIGFGAGHPGHSPYAATKWGIVGLVKSLAVELAPFGVRANAVLPGAVDGERTAADVAATCLYLSTPAACKVTGQAISVGGGGEHFLHASGVASCH